MSPLDARTLKRGAKQLIRRTGFEVRRVRPAPNEPEPVADAPYYDPSPTCQVPYLWFLYELFFGRRTDGLFVEVGAFDGWSYSNTSCLAAVGWHGHYLEPVPSSAEQCRARYAGNDHIQVHELAIGASEGELTIHVGGPLSTSDERTFEDYHDIAWAKHEFVEDVTVTVPQRTLDDFLHEQGIAPGFDLLVVDVEGYEPQVFEGFDLARWRPSMLIVEIADIHPDLDSSRRKHARLSAQIGAHGYVIAFKDVINTIYVRQDLWDTTFA